MCKLHPVCTYTFSDRFSRHSEGPEGVQFWEPQDILFKDNVVLLASSNQDLLHALERFAA